MDSPEEEGLFDAAAEEPRPLFIRMAQDPSERLP
jgi:hypothetical protein